MRTPSPCWMRIGAADGCSPRCRRERDLTGATDGCSPAAHACCPTEAARWGDEIGSSDLGLCSPRTDAVRCSTNLKKDGTFFLFRHDWVNPWRGVRMLDVGL
ncbi:hypothetical protein ACLOJK_039187 [Asimina triloba]